MTRIACKLSTLFLLFATINNLATAQQKITSVDFYGVRSLSVPRIKQSLGLGKGKALKLSSKELKQRINKIDGVIDCDVVQIRYPGNLALFIGIQEKGAKIAKFRTAPTGDLRLSTKLIEHYDSIMKLLLPAIQSGNSGEDQTKGHSLTKYPPMREKQVELVDIANKQYSLIRQVLKDSSDAKSRAAAAYILAYATNKKKVAQDLSFGCSDPSSLVRNNAVRALGILAKYGKKNPEAKLVISYQPFLQMLSSLTWTDRNKASAFFDSMTIDRDKEILQALKKDYLPELEEMARWRSSGHAFFSIRILARIAGLDEPDLISRCRNAKTHQLRQELVDHLLQKIKSNK